MFDTLVRDDPELAAATRSHPTRGGRILRERSVLLFVGLAALTWAAAPASSQSESPPAGSEAESEAANDDAFKGVEEMMVEARRRSESLQKIGESVTSFSGTDLFERGLVNFNDLQYNVPSLFSGGGLTKITLRGVGSEIVGPGTDPGFAVHVNGVFLRARNDRTDQLLRHRTRRRPAWTAGDPLG